MSRLILVPMKRGDRTEDLIPYIVRVARPGMKVVFMVPYPVNGFRWSHEEFGRKAIEDGKRLARYYTWDSNLRRAQDRVEPAVKGLSAKRIEVVVDLCTGSMRRSIRAYAANGDVHLIVARAGIGERILSFLNGSNSLFDLFKRPTLSPVLLIHPGVAA